MKKIEIGTHYCGTEELLSVSTCIQSRQNVVFVGKTSTQPPPPHTHAHLGVEGVGVHWLVVVVLVSVLVEADERLLEDLGDGGLAPASGAHAHQSMTHQLSLVELDHLADLCRVQGAVMGLYC